MAYTETPAGPRNRAERRAAAALEGKLKALVG